MSNAPIPLALCPPLIPFPFTMDRFASGPAPPGLLHTGTASLPLMYGRGAGGGAGVGVCCVLSYRPLVSVMVPVTENWMVSPAAAAKSSSRRVPKPLSARLVTVKVAALAAFMLSRQSRLTMPSRNQPERQGVHFSAFIKLLAPPRGR